MVTKEEVLAKHSSNYRKYQERNYGSLAQICINGHECFHAMEEYAAALLSGEDWKESAGQDGDPSKRLISMVERRMKKAGIMDALIDHLP